MHRLWGCTILGKCLWFDSSCFSSQYFSFSILLPRFFLHYSLLTTKGNMSAPHTPLHESLCLTKNSIFNFNVFVRLLRCEKKKSDFHTEKSKSRCLGLTSVMKSFCTAEHLSCCAAVSRTPELGVSKRRCSNILCFVVQSLWHRDAALKKKKEKEFLNVK